MRGQFPGDPRPIAEKIGCLSLGVILLLAVGMPIMGIMDGDIFFALLGPGFLLYMFSLKYLFSGHWLRLFRRKNDD